MFHNVVDLKLGMNHPTLCAGISTLHKHPLSFPLPPVTIIQAPDDAVRALLFLHPRMGGTAALGDQHTAAGRRTELTRHARPGRRRCNTTRIRSVRPSDPLRRNRGSALGLPLWAGRAGLRAHIDPPFDRTGHGPDRDEGEGDEDIITDSHRSFAMPNPAAQGVKRVILGSSARPGPGVTLLLA
jgi:hypothetical protein